MHYGFTVRDQNGRSCAQSGNGAWEGMHGTLKGGQHLAFGVRANKGRMQGVQTKGVQCAEAAGERPWAGLQGLVQCLASASMPPGAVPAANKKSRTTGAVKGWVPIIDTRGRCQSVLAVAENIQQQRPESLPAKGWEAGRHWQTVAPGAPRCATWSEGVFGDSFEHFTACRDAHT